MKKILYVLIMVMMVVCTTSCTKNVRARHWGGEMTINVPRNERVIEVTWKENSMWYLTEEMDENYIPKTKYFRESSELGIQEGTVIFIETK